MILYTVIAATVKASRRIIPGRARISGRSIENDFFFCYTEFVPSARILSVQKQLKTGENHGKLS